MKRLMKWTVSTAVVLCLLLACAGLLTMPAQAVSQGLEFELNADGVSYSVSGIGTCTDAEIVIPAEYNGLPVTGVDDYAFYRCTNLKRVTISYGVTEIRDCAFYGCTNLVSVTLPNGVRGIDELAFYYCKSLRNIEIPEGVTEIGYAAFEGCGSLTGIVIPTTLTSIYSNAFWGCPSLTSIQVREGNAVYHSAGNCLIETASGTLILACSTSIIPNDGSVTRIGYSAFEGIADLVDIVIPEGVTCIESYAFRKCSSLTGIVIPASVTSIYINVFSGCTGLTSIQVSEGNTVYHSAGNCLIDTASGKLIAGCSTSIIPDDGSVTQIGSAAFEGHMDLTDIVIPDSVETIGYSAFEGCTSLSAVSIGSGVRSIEAYVFYGCDNLTGIYFAGSPEQWAAISKEEDWDYGLEDYTVYYVGEGHKHSYSVMVIPPSCTVPGYTNHICSCGYSSKTDYVPALGHNYVAEQTVAPSCEQAGLMTYTCSHCYDFYTELLPRLEAEAEQIPAVSSNSNDYDYVSIQRWATPIYSALTWESGGYTRAEAIGDMLIVERYDERMKFVSRRNIPLDMPIFGGVYLCEDYNFVVVGQTNHNEDDTTEVIRLVCYTKDWVRVGTAGLFGANTVIPFDAGSLRFARVGDLLYVRTCHEMYTSSDGKNHQANLTFCVDISTMTVVDEFSHVWNNSTGYVSHSFNQFILVDGNELLAVDHGDAHPRSVALFKYHSLANFGSVSSNASMVNVLNIADSTAHYNYTGVALGGFECSDTHYLIAGNSASQAGGISFVSDQRNIFITATPKDSFTDAATTIHWITDYKQGDDVRLGTPYLIKLDDGRFFLMWRVDDAIHCCFITADGQREGKIYVVEGMLSDCMPLQRGNQLVWYTTSYSAPVFYALDLNDPSQVTTVSNHTYESVVIAPTATDQGYTIYTCSVCGHSYQDNFTDPVGLEGWQSKAGAWYYYINGKKATGWQYINYRWYYFHADGKMATGWLNLNGTWYYLNAGGDMTTGWQYINYRWYYMKPSGAMATGWLNLGGTWYYLNAGGDMAIGWRYINYRWYYMKPSGAMATGWLNLNGTWYYLNASGAMVTGWQYINYQWYYFHAGGNMATGWITVDGTQYYLSASGVWIPNP